MTDIVLRKRVHSEEKIAELSRKLNKYREVTNFEHLTIYAAGSYGRLEASRHSDIDLFFMYTDTLTNLEEPNINGVRLFARIIDIVDDLGFPKLSNDGEFLTIIEKEQIFSNIGGRNDDYFNFFTARMLLLLESRCVYNEIVHKTLVEDIIEAYYRDYHDHPKSFRPTFLVNDIIRFWKTLCLNYEHKRNQPVDDETKKIKQKIKNFKLKFSRLLTCFATVAIISSFKEPVTKEKIFEIVQLPPIDRLDRIESANDKIDKYIKEIRFKYNWFLTLTDLSESKLTSFLWKKITE